MRFEEMLDVECDSLPPAKMLTKLREQGLPFESINSMYTTAIRVIYPHVLGSDAEYQRIVAAVRVVLPTATFWRRVNVGYDPEDIEQAELFCVSGKRDVYVIPDPPKKVACLQCGKEWGDKNFDESFQVRKVKCKDCLISLHNFWTEAVSSKARVMFEEAGLRGCRFAPLDHEDRYFHLIATSSLGKQVLKPEEFFGLRGVCSKCGLPQFDMSFGPKRFRRVDWDGSDFVVGLFNSRNTLYSKKAVDVLRQCDRKFGDIEPVFLE